MNAKHTIDKLWNEMRDSIDASYTQYQSEFKSGAALDENEERSCLRDYARNISWHDRMSELLGRETANERQHRSNRPSVPGFSNQTAAKLILMSQMSRGAQGKKMLSAAAFLVFRREAIEAQVIGYLTRATLPQAWHDAVRALDYGELMKAGQ